MKRFALVIALSSISIGAASVGTASATSATTPKKDGNDCVFISTVGQYRVLDRSNVVIWAPGRRNAYLLELSMPLFGLKSSMQVAMIDRDHDGRLCGFSMDKIAVRDFGQPEAASIRRMNKLGDEDIVQLEEKYGVQLKSKKAEKKTS
jgi:hypothetical protein